MRRQVFDFGSASGNGRVMQTTAAGCAAGGAALFHKRPCLGHPGAPACCTCAAGRRLKRVVPWLGHGLLWWQAPPAQGWGNTLECRARPCLCSLTYRPYDVRVAGWQLGHCFDVGVAAFVGRAARFLGTGHGRHGEGSGWAGTGQVLGGRQRGEHCWYPGKAPPVEQAAELSADLPRIFRVLVLACGFLLCALHTLCFSQLSYL